MGTAGAPGGGVIVVPGVCFFSTLVVGEGVLYPLSACAAFVERDSRDLVKECFAGLAVFAFLAALGRC